MSLEETFWSSLEFIIREFILFLNASLIHQQEPRISFTAADAAGTLWQAMALLISDIKALKLCPAKSLELLPGSFSAAIPNQNLINEGKLLMACISEHDF